MASSALLAQIQAGKRLKKAETNDRSAPAVDGGPRGGGAASKPSGGIGGIGAALAAQSAGSASAGGPPQLGGLFAGGMPKLKPAGQSNFGMLSETADSRKTSSCPKAIVCWGLRRSTKAASPSSSCPGTT
ncbi:hypothetical protein EST38_g1153 [Candolleomyces aberdarensis]|uniref:WH2 domain-containing protein n=1 Tax=Candolleomyces aberdarensis TaxID=2316362 RepID=A0A4Q2DVM4_9AGAR|nr:hypothetical protein EST38_g1153 [Candolleomyces aberdarensis]